jgi:hypothetical protein
MLKFYTLIDIYDACMSVLQQPQLVLYSWRSKGVNPRPYNFVPQRRSLGAALGRHLPPAFATSQLRQ